MKKESLYGIRNDVMEQMALVASMKSKTLAPVFARQVQEMEKTIEELYQWVESAIDGDDMVYGDICSEYYHIFNSEIEIEVMK